MRIAFAGYEGEHEFPPSWSCHKWKTNGGYAHTGDDEEGTGRVNSSRERLWFSPACLRERTLFDEGNQ